MAPPLARTARRGLLALLVAAVATIAPLGLGSGPAVATPVPATDAVLTWPLSEQAWTSSSLAYTAGPPPAAPASDMVAPAVRGANGFEFSVADATYDPATGAATASFDGSFALGNTNQGGYRVRIGSPTVTVDADGSGEIVADVAHCASAAACTSPGFTEVTDVVVATFSTSSVAVKGTTVTISATPDFVPQHTGDGSPVFAGAREISAELTQALPASLRGHFRETVQGTPQPLKAPSPFTLSFTYVPGPDPTPFVSVVPQTELDPSVASTEVTVRGLGFLKADLDTDPNGLGVYVRYCVATTGRPTTADCMPANQLWVGPTSPPANALLDADGDFEVTLAVPSTFTSGSTTFDCTELQCGISIRRDHNGGATDLTYDSFTPVTFAEGPEPTVPPTEPTVPPTQPTVPEDGVGSLDWGVRASFRSYVLQGPAQGAIDVAAPASQNPDGTFRFDAGTPVTYEGPHDVVAQFEGAVRFTGHHGALDLSISEPRVEIDPTGAVLVVDASSKDLDTGQVTVLDDVAIADLDVASAPPTAVGDVVTFDEIPATLTEEGSVAFGEFYAAGDPLDPVTFSIQVDDPGELPPPPVDEEELAGCVPDTVAAGDVVTVCGEGFVPGEQVQVFLHSDPVFLDVVIADDDGSVTASVVIPATTPPGLHRLELRGVTSGKSLFSLEFTVTASAASPGALARTGTDADRPAIAGVVFLLVGLVVVDRARRVRARAT